MSREIYSAVSGASAALAQMDVVSHNLANVGTAGYKARKTTFQLSDGANNQGVLGQAYVEPGESPLDLGNGPLEKTDDPFDLAIQGRGFFAVENAQTGQQLLTRNGSFLLDSQGFIANSDGHRLQSTSGPILLQPGQTFSVGDDARITLIEQNGGRTEMGFLQILDGDVKPVGATTFEATGPTEDLSQVPIEPGEAPAMQVRQEHLERSNVNPLGAMVELIEASRYFEAYQKMMKSGDEADSRLIRTGRA